MTISVEKINNESPYWVIQLDELNFRFRTKNGLTYHVGFYPDKFFMPGYAYHFYIDNIHDIKGPIDTNIFKVVSLVLKEFFSENSSVMLYICDAHDHRELKRASLYKRWYDRYPDKSNLLLRAADLQVENYTIYTGMILRKDNPLYEKIVKAFDEFTSKLPEFLLSDK